MRNNASMIYGFLLLVGDFLALLLAFVIAYIIRVQLDTRALAAQIPSITYLKIFLVLLPFWLLIFAMLGLYNQDTYERRFQEFSRLLTGSAVGIMFIITVAFILRRPIFPARIVPVYALAISFGLIVIERSLLRAMRKVLFGYGIGINNVVIIGNSPATSELAVFLGDTATSGYRIQAICGPESLVPKGMHTKHFGSVEDTLENLDGAHTIVQTELFQNDNKNQAILDAARNHHIAYKFIPANSLLYTGNNTIELFHNFPVIAVHQTPLIGWGRIAKRLFDIGGAIIGLIVSIPVIAVFGTIIKLTDPKYPLFYKHKRVSRFGDVFYVYKLRSMYGRYSPGLGTNKSPTEIFKEMGHEKLVEEFETNQKVMNDPRIMPIGRFLRKSGLDELPQLWNVLKGNLSLIGPRAVTKEELKRYAKASSLFLSIKPGITGLWQVSGRNEISYDERIQLDLYYVQHWSFLLDLKIVYRTLLVMVGGKGH